MTLAVTSPTFVEVGKTYLCKGSSAGQAVLVWVGQIDPVTDGGLLSDGMIVSVSIVSHDVPDQPSVGHSPFDGAAFSDCIETTIPFPAVASENFRDGYDTWRTAHNGGKAGYWTLSPSDAYWAMMEVIKQ
jgi:hypothetical protein